MPKRCYLTDNISDGSFKMSNKSSLQVVVATMHQKDFSKYEKMNLSTDAVFANQADETSYSEKTFGNSTAKMITTATRGVGINRNIGLQYATGDILLIADDDMVYSDDYEKTVIKAFEENPQADALIFNIETIGADKGRRLNNKSIQLHLHNGLNYGAARLAVRRSCLVRERIFFSTCFGGGTIYSAGEDTLFICDMLKKKLKIFTYPATIASVDQTTSTWFTGYNKKLIYDRGAFFGASFGKAAPLLCVYNLFRHKYIYKEANLTFAQAFKIMCEGTQGYKKLKTSTDDSSEN